MPHNSPQRPDCNSCMSLQYVLYMTLYIKYQGHKLSGNSVGAHVERKAQAYNGGE